VDLVIMRSVGRKGMPRLLLGSVAGSVIRHADRAVTIVRPPRTQKAYSKSSVLGAGGGERAAVVLMSSPGTGKTTLGPRLVEHWFKSVSPSYELRSWFSHDPAKSKKFQRRCFAELNEQPETWEALLEAARDKEIALVYSARNTEHNNAVALKSLVERKLACRPRGKSAKRILA
jgi:uncharacterized protein YeaO (DUF488 family)